MLIPAAPLSGWLRENIGPQEVFRWASAHDLDESYVRRLRDGAQVLVHIDTADKLLGPHGLRLLYPALFEFEAAR